MKLLLNFQAKKYEAFLDRQLQQVWDRLLAKAVSVVVDGMISDLNVHGQAFEEGARIGSTVSLSSIYRQAGVTFNMANIPE